MKAKTQAQYFNEKSISEADIKKANGIWCLTYACYVFPDRSSGVFTDLRNGACERDGAGNPILRFVAHEGRVGRI